MHLCLLISSPRLLPVAIARCCGWLLLGTLLLGSISSVLAQPAAQRIIDGEAFDRLTLDEANENAVIKVKPIPFPNRRVPAKPKPSDKLRVKLLEDTRDFEVAWQNIKKVELFENMILAQASTLAAAGKIDEAYDFFVYLIEQYPKTEGLPEARQMYLYRAAGLAFGQKSYAEALGILEELRSLNPDFRASETAPTVMLILGNTADNLVGSYVAKQDYRSARMLLERLIRSYQAGNEPFATKWVTQLSELASAERDKAKALLAEGKFVEAYDASTRMKNIWPAVAGGDALIAEMSRRYPLVIVGVSQPAKAFDSRSLIDPAARRAGRLVQQQLMDFSGMGPEGGKYSSPFGTFVRSDDGTNFSLDVKAQGNRALPLSAFDVSQRLLQLAEETNPDYQAAWARLVSTVQVKQATQVQVDLRLPHVLPEALLQVDALPSKKDAASNGLGPFQVLSTAAGITRFARNDLSPFIAASQPAEVVERYYDDPQRAILALKRGEVDLLDQVFSGDLAALLQDTSIVVKPYSAPTTHMILINREHPYLANRTFRRALLYATDRQAILQQGLLKGQNLPGWRVISGPFPAPSGSGDNVAYGYDEQIAPRAYDPRLAIVLKVLAQRQLKVAAEKDKKEPAKWRPLLLGHPADEGSRLACRALVKQWEIVGIEVKLQEFPLGVFRDPQNKCDLTYVQAATWEPIIDAARLFGDEGLAPTDNAFIRLAIRQIETATNWQQVRQRMQQLHHLVNEDIALLPLWQTYDYYAFRQGMTSLESNRASLYQNVRQWQPAARLASN